MTSGYFHIDHDGVRYNILCKTIGDPKMFSQTSYTFDIELDGILVPLDFHVDRELVQDLCAIVGLDPVDELKNIVISSIKEEISTILKKRG